MLYMTRRESLGGHCCAPFSSVDYLVAFGNAL